MKPIRIRNKSRVVNADSTLPLEDEDDYLVTDIAVNFYDYTNAGSIGSYDYTEDGVSSYDYGNEDEDEAA